MICKVFSDIVAGSIKASKSVHSMTTFKPECENETYLYGCLKLHSRSFYLVIMQMEDKLRYEIGVFYCVLRMLDTIEDENKISEAERIDMVKNFHRVLQQDDSYILPEHKYSIPKEDELMKTIPSIIKCLNNLSFNSREVILDCCKQMGEGMALKLGMDDVVDELHFDRYCYSVAGVLGPALTDIFRLSEKLAEDIPIHLSVSMGLMLQKINIIKDVTCDLLKEGGESVYVPSSIIKKYFSNIRQYAGLESCESNSVNSDSKHDIDTEDRIELNKISNEGDRRKVLNQPLVEIFRKLQLKDFKSSKSNILDEIDRVILGDFSGTIDPDTNRCLREILGKCFPPTAPNGPTDSMLTLSPKERRVCATWELVTTATDHVQDCVEYFIKLGDSGVFVFCVLPQIMAFLTFYFVLKREYTSLKDDNENVTIEDKPIKIPKLLTYWLLIVSYMGPFVVLYHYKIINYFMTKMVEKTADNLPKSKIQQWQPARSKIIGSLNMNRTIIQQQISFLCKK